MLANTIATAPRVHRRTNFIVPICENCRFWQAEPDGIAGDCSSPDFCEMVWAKWEPLSPVMVSAAFHCDYWEQAE